LQMKLLFALLLPLAAAVTLCDPCWTNKYGCSSYFVSDCSNGATYAYYKSTSTTSWLAKCKDGTYYSNPNACTYTVNGVANCCRVLCSSVGSKRNETQEMKRDEEQQTGEGTYSFKTSVSNSETHQGSNCNSAFETTWGTATEHRDQIAEYGARENLNNLFNFFGKDPAVRYKPNSAIYFFVKASVIDIYKRVTYYARPLYNWKSNGILVRAPAYAGEGCIDPGIYLFSDYIGPTTVNIAGVSYKVQIGDYYGPEGVYKGYENVHPKYSEEYRTKRWEDIIKGPVFVTLG
jgi:hypothetical protein